MTLESPVLIVGTGRCGSTALSRVVASHPRWLSLSECFGSLLPDAFPEGPVPGPAFERLLRTPRQDMSLILAHRLEPEEFLYPVDSGAGRFSRETGVPPLSMACLPHLGGTGDDLLEDLCAEVRGWEAAPVGHHYRRLFDGLAGRFGRERWIERSGGSLACLGPLLEAFPEARIVHLWRDGLACSASMARHSPFRLGLMRREMVRRFGVDPYASTARPPALLASEYAGVLPESFDPDAFRGLDLPLSKFAGIWSSQILHGTARLAEVPAERVLHLRFEDLLADPAGQIRHLSAFIEGEAEEGWIREAAGLIDPGRATPPPVRADARTRRLIEEGRRILRAAGVPGA